MDPAELEHIVTQYRALRPGGGVCPDVVAEIERVLGIVLPADFKRIAEVFGGGRIGDFVHYGIASVGESSIVAKTLEFRDTIGLARQFVALGGPKGRFVAFDLEQAPAVVSVPWYDKESLACRRFEDLHPCQLVIHPSYGEFFRSLVITAVTEGRRKIIRSGIATLRDAETAKLRRRWDRGTLVDIHRFLRSGRTPSQPLPSIEVDGERLVDLRGITFLCSAEHPVGDVAWYDLYRKWLTLSPEQRMAAKGKPSPFEFDPQTHVMHAHIDFSYCQPGMASGLNGVDFKRCRFVGSTLPQHLGYRFISCDFSRANLSNCIFHGEYHGCRFVGANLKGASGGNTRFDQCDFSGVDFRSAHFIDCVFDNCIWDACCFGFGSFAGSEFPGTAPNPNDLGDTIMA